MKIFFLNLLLISAFDAYSREYKPQFNIWAEKTKIRNEIKRILKPVLVAKNKLKGGYKVTQILKYDSTYLAVVEFDEEGTEDDKFPKDSTLYFVNLNKKSYTNSGIKGYQINLAGEIKRDNDYYLFFEMSNCAECEPKYYLQGIFITLNSYHGLKMGQSIFKAYSGSSAQHLEDSKKMSSPEQCSIITKKTTFQIRCGKKVQKYSFQAGKVIKN